jgi:hypothetical protein
MVGTIEDKLLKEIWSGGSEMDGIQYFTGAFSVCDQGIITWFIKKKVR